jgi:hypothetical protein
MLVHRVHGKKWWFRAPWLPSVSSGGFFLSHSKDDNLNMYNDNSFFSFLCCLVQ